MLFKKRKLVAAMVMVGAITLVGCGGGDTSKDDGTQDEVAATAQSTAAVGTADHDVLLPASVETEALSGDVDGSMIFTGSPEQTTAKSVSAAGRLSKAVLSPRDVAGFFAQRPAFNGEANASEMLESLTGTISLRYNTLKSTGTQQSPSLNAAFSSYAVNTISMKQPTELASELLGDVGINKIGGIIDTLPVAGGVEPFATEFTVQIGIVYYSENEVMVLVCVLPSNLAGTYSTVTTAVTNGTIVSPTAGAQKTSESNEFTVQDSSGKADFLFVIDNSSSMRGEQLAISDAATEFVNAIATSGLDFQVGTITTDSDLLRDTNGDGGFTSDVTEYQSDVKPGVRGDTEETGIWFAEKSLQDVGQGDVRDGTVTTAGYPRTDASMNIVIMSDEKSQYTGRSGGVPFDENNNLFVDRGYTVHSIILPSQNNRSQYDDLAFATGGSTADISDVSTFPAIMSNIAKEAGGATSAFVLTQTPIASTLSVKVNGLDITNSAADGWEYNTANNSILFNGLSLPSGGDVVAVDYDYF